MELLSEQIFLSEKGQLVIPKKMREKLGLKRGARLLISLNGDEITLRPVHRNPVSELFGMFRGHDLLGALKEERKKELERETKKHKK